MGRWDSKYNRTVAEVDNITILGSKTDNHKFWLVVNSDIVREDILTDDETAMLFYGYFCGKEFDIL